MFERKQKENTKEKGETVIILPAPNAMYTARAVERCEKPVRDGDER